MRSKQSAQYGRNLAEIVKLGLVLGGQGAGYVAT